MNIHVTRHAEDRIRERTRLPKRAVERLVYKAAREGLPSDAVQGYLGEWCRAKEGRKVGYVVRLLHDRLFIFNEAMDACVTVITVPKELRS